jgi:hypothetical protein
MIFSFGLGVFITLLSFFLWFHNFIALAIGIAVILVFTVLEIAAQIIIDNYR